MIESRFISELQELIPYANENTYMELARGIQDSGVPLPSTLAELHVMILESAIAGTARELGKAKVQTLGEVFNQSYVENFEDWLEDTEPLLVTKDEALREVTLKLIHKVETLKRERTSTKKAVIMEILMNTVRIWVAGVVFGLLLHNYRLFSGVKVVLLFSSMASIVSPISVLLESNK